MLYKKALKFLVPSAKTMVVVHLLMTIIWFACMVGVVFAPEEFQQSILLVLVVSFYANFVGHFSAFEAALADLRSPDAEEV